MLDFSDRTRTGISILTSAADKPAEVCREVLDFYGNISNAEVPQLPDTPRVEGGLGPFTVERTTELLRAAEKSDSRVDGDPLAHLVRCYPEAFAVPVAAIYNTVNDRGYWPTSWKTEHLTIIPKNPNPSGLTECRNISCTSIFSKILEGVVLEQLRGELIPDPRQYGGVPKCGTEHMLVDMWERVLASMEGGKNAAVLLGVDYEKAFNRMGHAKCLVQLRRLGASEGSLALVRAFLENRRMTININGEGAATPFINITRGSPQGSVLGCLLYCVTTQSLTDDLRRGPAHIYFPQDDSPDPGVEFWRGDAENKPEAFLHVDDTTLFEAVPMEGAVRHITAGEPVESFDNMPLEKDLRELAKRAEDRGMKLNAKKTQLLVISPGNGYRTTASMVGPDGVRINSIPSLKLVGFTFGEEPGAGAHVATIEEAFRRKKWMIHNLRDAGFKGKDLFRLYCCYVRSMIEYCSPVLHPMLTGAQRRRLESLNRHAVRACFGYNTPVEEAMAENGIEDLEARRQRRFDAFVRKSAASERFGPLWYPMREEDMHELRARREIVETRAATRRLFMSPLAAMRRRANELGVVPSGQT